MPVWAYNFAIVLNIGCFYFNQVNNVADMQMVAFKLFWALLISSIIYYNLINLYINYKIKPTIYAVQLHIPADTSVWKRRLSSLGSSSFKLSVAGVVGTTVGVLTVSEAFTVAPGHFGAVTSAGYTASHMSKGITKCKVLTHVDFEYDRSFESFQTMVNNKEIATNPMKIRTQNFNSEEYNLVMSRLKKNDNYQAALNIKVGPMLPDVTKK